MQDQRFQSSLGNLADFCQIAADKRFAPGQSNRVHDGELCEDPINLVQRQIPFRGHLPGIAHDAFSVTAKRHGIGQKSWQVSLVISISIDATHKRESAVQHDGLSTEKHNSFRRLVRPHPTWCWSELADNDESLQERRHSQSLDWDQSAREFLELVQGTA